MERIINDTFILGNQEFAVVESNVLFPNKCFNCAFYNHEKGCVGILIFTGDCRAIWRKDKKEVVFVRI